MSSLEGTFNDQAPPTVGADLRLARRLLAYLKHEWRLVVLALMLYPIDAIAVVLPPYLVQQILDHVIPEHDVHRLYVLGALYVVALVLEYASGFASQLAMGVLGQRATKRIRAELFAHVQRLPAGFFDKTPIGRLLTRLTNDVEALSDVFATGAITVVADIVVIAAVVASMLLLDVRMTLFSFLVVPPLMVTSIVFQRFARRAFRAVRRSLARINTYLAEHLSGMATVQVFRQQQRVEREFEALNLDYRDANRTAVLCDASLYAIVEAIGTAAIAALIWYGANDLTMGLVGAGTLVAFIQYIRRFFVPIRDMSTKYTIIQSAFAAAERIFHLFDEPVTIRSPLGAKDVSRLHRAIAFEKVWFSYAKGSEWVLRGLDLTIERGEHIALVGATGAGKTTVLKLLGRNYDLTRGRLSIDGVDVRQLDLAQLRRLFAVVLQDVFLFSGTVLDNLTISGRVSPEEAQRAARVVQADELIARLPLGYDTHLREAGVNLSAGERQLLAFARALAQNPDVLILDEATSSIDSQTEARLQQGLDVLLKDRTAIVVAHRLSTIRKADRIVVLQDGRVAEEGNHQTLMQRGGLYQRLVELQLDANSKSA